MLFSSTKNFSSSAVRKARIQPAIIFVRGLLHRLGDRTFGDVEVDPDQHTATLGVSLQVPSRIFRASGSTVRTGIIPWGYIRSGRLPSWLPE